MFTKNYLQVFKNALVTNMPFLFLIFNFNFYLPWPLFQANVKSNTKKFSYSETRNDYVKTDGVDLKKNVYGY